MYVKYILQMKKNNGESIIFELPYNEYKFVLTDRNTNKSLIKDLNFIFSKKIDSILNSTLSDVADKVNKLQLEDIQLSIQLSNGEQVNLLPEQTKIIFVTYRIENDNFSDEANSLVEKLILDLQN